ncbi:MAG: IS110 family transposase [Candidatus Latescibacteria bacterium]|nr:IS110 family transposase [Candidatus Latescibacterota bacterium]
MHPVNHIGIDVSAASLSAVCRNRRDQHRSATFNNDPAGHRKLIAWATKGDAYAQVCLEATGVYSLDLALALHHHPKTAVMVVNPRLIKDFAGALNQRAKTDPLDAEVILAFLERMPFQPFQPPSEEVMQLQALTRRIAQLKGILTQENNRLHADHHRQSLDAGIRQDIQLHLRYLKKQIQYLEAQALELVQAHDQLQSTFTHLISVTGIATTSALQLMAELLVLPGGLQPGQWVAQAGLDPRPRDSGTSIHMPRFISKTGNKYLRAALYMPALVALRYQPNVRAFYEKLVGAGKKKMQALVAVMRKLLRCLWGMLKYQQDFDGSKFYQLT